MATSESNSSADAFHATVANQISAFNSARLMKRVTDGTLKLPHYHSILCTIFHQTYAAPYTFAKAAANCSWRHEAIKEYLLEHAEEERTHWRWVLNDLANTGYTGPNPRDMFPHATCEAFISFQDKCSDRMPIARLAIAAVLEGIGSSFGASNHGRKLLETLRLSAKQVSFFLSHGETDKKHNEELRAVISASDLSSEEWGWMGHAATIGGTFYRAMYDHKAFE